MPPSLPAHVAPRIRVGPSCWLWAGRRSTAGEGVVTVGGRAKRVHRLVFEVFVAQLAPGALLFRRCGNPACVNPAHQLLGTAKDRAALTRSAGRYRNAQAEKTACKHGHPLTPGNFYRRGRNNRTCKACSDARVRARRARLRGVQPASLRSCP